MRSRHPCRRSMLCCPVSAAAHQSAAVAFNVEDGGRRASPISIGLREQCADRSACIVGKTSTVCAQCLGSSDLRSSTIRPCFQRSDVAALATNSRAYSLQTGGSGPPSTARQRSRIPWTVHSAVRRSESIITAICIIQSSSHCASSSLDCWCKGVYGIWASSMEQFAV